MVMGTEYSQIEEKHRRTIHIDQAEDVQPIRAILVAGDGSVAANDDVLMICGTTEISNEIRDGDVIVVCRDGTNPWTTLMRLASRKMAECGS
jgi:ABC-type sugar transport system substrate-binding protein